MATTPTSINAPARGITRTFDDYIVHGEKITTLPIIDQTPDQLGAIADEQVYDHRYELTLSIISKTSARTPPVLTNDQITYDSKLWLVDSCEETGSYNDKLKWDIRAHRYTNTPTAS
jgi:hypothetical protein